MTDPGRLEMPFSFYCGKNNALLPWKEIAGLAVGCSLAPFKLICRSTGRIGAWPR